MADVGVVVVRAQYSRTWQKLFGVLPWRRYIALEIVGRGWTQARHPGEIEYMVLDWLECNGEDTTQGLLILWN